MKALLIPANSSEPVTKIDFDRDESWRYILTRYNDPDEPPYVLTEVAFLTTENAQRDYLLRNSRASEYLKNHSDGFDSPEDLYGDVVVVGYDSTLEKLTHLPWPHSPEDFEDLVTRIPPPPPFGLSHPGDSVRMPERLEEIGVTSAALDDGFEPGDSVRIPERLEEIGVTSAALDDGFEPGDSVRIPER
jgi:hypothetical protein